MLRNFGVGILTELREKSQLIAGSQCSTQNRSQNLSRDSARILNRGRRGAAGVRGRLPRHGEERRVLREGVRVGDLRVPIAGALRAAATILAAVGRRSARRQGCAKLQCKFETPKNLPKFRMTNRTSIQLD